MKDNSYLITGASSYLGTALANFYSKDNNRVILTSRSYHEDIACLQNDKTLYLPDIDLVDDHKLDSLAKKVEGFFDSRFHVINCVGYFPDYKPIEKMSLNEAKMVLDSNVLAVFSVANRILPIMSKRGGGHFIGFSTHTTYQHYPNMALFSCAKIALESLIKGLSNEYLKEGIIANVISLATLQTETERRIKPHGDYSNWLQTEEVCNIVDYLIEHSNGLVNGSVIHAYKYSRTFFGESYFNRIRR